MPKFMVFCWIGLVIVAAAEPYCSSKEGYDYAAGEYNEVRPPNTEYFTFSAADDDFSDGQEIQHFSNLVRPQQVVFIRTPEKNIFSLTAEQLAKQNSLNIYVLRRQTDSAGLLSQLQEIRQRVGEKPNVNFVKYRTPEDLNQAKKTIYHEYETLPGSSQYHEDTETPVYEYNPHTQDLQEQNPQHRKSSDPVIFQIIKHRSALNLKGLEESSKSDAQPYLPPNLM